MIDINEHITTAANEPLRPVRTGIWKRVLVDAPTLGVDEIYFEEGIATDGHGHDLSQAAYQVSGRFEVRLGSSVVTLGRETATPSRLGLTTACAVSRKGRTC